MSDRQDTGEDEKQSECGIGRGRGRGREGKGRKGVESGSLESRSSHAFRTVMAQSDLLVPSFSQSRFFSYPLSFLSHNQLSSLAVWWWWLESTLRGIKAGNPTFLSSPRYDKPPTALNGVSLPDGKRGERREREKREKRNERRRGGARLSRCDEPARRPRRAVLGVNTAAAAPRWRGRRRRRT